MPEKSFYDVLAEQVRSELRSQIKAEVEAEVLSKQKATEPAKPDFITTSLSEQLESWLVTHAERFQSKLGNHKSRAYTSGSKNEARAVSQKDQRISEVVKNHRVTLTTVEDLCALELLRRTSGAILCENISEAELKSAWRRAALKAHPDRFVGADAITKMRQATLFAELTFSYERLAGHFEKNSLTQAG